MDNVDPSEFFLTQTWGGPDNFLSFEFISLIVSSNINVLLSFFSERSVNNPFKFISFFGKVDKLLEVDYKVQTCTELVPTKKLAASSLWKFVYHFPKGISKPLPLDFTWISVVKCCLHNLYGSRQLIPRLELTKSQALFVDGMPSKATVSTPSAEKIE